LIILPVGVQPAGAPAPGIDLFAEAMPNLKMAEIRDLLRRRGVLQWQYTLLSGGRRHDLVSDFSGHGSILPGIEQ
jgi:hypothetical protein